MTLSEYVKKRNGVSIGNPKSLRYNLYKSFGAVNFSTFWNFWNPIFGYYLGKFIFKPLKSIFSVSISLIFTFLLCGLIHDMVTLIFKGSTSFLFSVWFLIMSLAVLITRHLKQDHSKQKWVIHASINLSIISFCFLLSLYFTRILIKP
ncbi:hypothetical protein LX95_02792 [Mesonia algae]|uniref:Acyltransferase n=1 Tax=Mesonia algae TaxID=213248 RepID=A0A2W7HYN1_9FLAO|nr:hypothetical protein LX95_02792 [Mesonia algae]